jgi:hypothetical protein
MLRISLIIGWASQGWKNLFWDSPLERPRRGLVSGFPQSFTSPELASAYLYILSIYF